MPHSALGHEGFTFQSGSILMDTTVALGLMANAFTFQSGSILIRNQTIEILQKLKPFTFQSGSILIKTSTAVKRKYNTNLHSNLVLF